MANRGYDVVVDVDEEGDLGHTDLQEDNLEFHSSNFDTAASKSVPTNGHIGSSHKRTASSSSALQSKKYLWSISFYAQFFDVDTNDVLKRCAASVFPRSNFLDVLEGNPDLYGPFWIATTVVVILFLTGTMSKSLAGKDMAHSGYDFKLLSGAAGLVYGYTAVIPSLLWGALKYSGSEAASLLETLSLYGYANLIWIPVALISWSNISILNYVFVGIGFVLSCLFLVRNLWPVINSTPKQRAKILLIVVVVLHFGLAVAIKFLFFANGSLANKKSGGKDGGLPASGGGKGEDTDTDDDKQAMMLMARMAESAVKLL
ncbi:MAG: hypothetical protein Q9162_006565 [Coniocarpon cinnabarinum]